MDVKVVNLVTFTSVKDDKPFIKIQSPVQKMYMKTDKIRLSWDLNIKIQLIHTV